MEPIGEPGRTPSMLGQRFRGFLPVIVDVETGGFNKDTDAILQLAGCSLEISSKGKLQRADTWFYEVIPFPGARLEPAALAFTGIDPRDPARRAVAEDAAFRDLFSHVRRAVKLHGCSRAILVGHNAPFDLGFVNAASDRNNIKRNPFHPFSTLDTVSLAALAYGQTVLARACVAAGLAFDNQRAHHAGYDAEMTADLFCAIFDQWHQSHGWPRAGDEQI